MKRGERKQEGKKKRSKREGGGEEEIDVKNKGEEKIKKRKGVNSSWEKDLSKVFFKHEKKRYYLPTKSLINPITSKKFLSL